MLMRRDLDWVILRPSVVLGPAAYGGSALFRGLAALPVLPVMPDTGPLQVVQLEDVVETVLFFLDPAAPSRLAVDLVGPEPLSMLDIVRRFRAWLGWPAPRIVNLPAAIAALLYRLGDLAGRLGWRPPLRSTAREEIRRGAAGDPSRWTALTGISPRPLAAALAARPASVQERWFAGLYALKPAVFVVYALFWIVTGVLSLGPGYRIGRRIDGGGRRRRAQRPIGDRRRPPGPRDRLRDRLPPQPPGPASSRRSPPRSSTSRPARWYAPISGCTRSGRC